MYFVLRSKLLVPVDRIVYLAGGHWPFAAQGGEPELRTTMIETVIYGLVRVMGEAVLIMVPSARRGHIVINSSLTAYRGLPKNLLGYTPPSGYPVAGGM